MMVEDKTEEIHVNVTSEKVKPDEPQKGEMEREVVTENIKKVETEPIKGEEVVKEIKKLPEEPKKGEEVVKEIKKLEEEPKKGEVVTEKMNKLQEEPNNEEVVVNEVKKLEEEPKKGEELKEEKKNKEEEKPTISEVIRDEKKEEVKNANVKEGKDIVTREILSEQDKKVEEENDRDIRENMNVVEQPKIGESSVLREEKIKEEEPNKSDIAVVEQKNIQEEPGPITQTIGDVTLVQEDNAKKIVEESDSSLLEKSSSLKDENKFGFDLKEHEKKAFNELKLKIEEAILENNFLIKKTDEQNEKLPPEPIEEEKVKPISEETKISIEASSDENEAINEVDKKDEKHTKKEEVEVNNDQEKEKQEEKCSPIVEVDKLPSHASIDENFIEIALDERDISLWGVPLLPSKGCEATNVIILKFLRAKDFKVNEAFDMLRNTIQWRKELKIDSILDEDFGSDLNSVAYMDGLDLEGHPICYNMYGIFEDNELYQKTFGTEEKRQQFLRWRFQLMEKGIQKLDFNSGGVTSLLQINDLKNSPGPSKKELRMAMKQGVADLQDNYPEFVARNIFVNVPFWYYAFNAVLSPFLTQRTKSKFVFARPSKVTETLLKYIPVEQVPIRYGGLKRENDYEFVTDEESVVTELAIKAGATEIIEIPALEVGTTILWDLSILGWEVNYKVEFVPYDEGSYTIIVQKEKKMGLNEEPVRNSFKSNEPGKIILTIENSAYKKKRVFYRFKTYN